LSFIFLIRHFRLDGEFISFAREKETEPKKSLPPQLAQWGGNSKAKEKRKKKKA